MEMRPPCLIWHLCFWIEFLSKLSKTIWWKLLSVRFFMNLAWWVSGWSPAGPSLMAGTPVSTKLLQQKFQHTPTNCKPILKSWQWFRLLGWKIGRMWKIPFPAVCYTINIAWTIVNYIDIARRAQVNLIYQVVG